MTTDSRHAASSNHQRYGTPDTFELAAPSPDEEPKDETTILDHDETYYDLEYEGILTEEEMITLVEEELSRRARRREAHLLQRVNDTPCPFLLHLCLVIGVIDEAMVVNAQ